MTDDSYSVIDISAWREGSPEPMGRSGKVWIVGPDEDDDLRGRWLFKPVEWQREQGMDVFPKGMDWAERIASSIAPLLGIPAARVELAVGEPGAPGQPNRGIISRKVNGDLDLAHGNEILSVLGDGRSPYSLDAIWRVLRRFGVAAPLGRDGALGADGWFAGYLVFDALIANSDRHDQNWAVLIDLHRGRGVSLAPSYDHASALGFQISDAEREERLTTRDHGRSMAAFARRGQARPFAGRPSLVELATAACRATGTIGHWHHVMEGTSEAALESTVTRMPTDRMSEVARRFTVELLQENRRRLIDALASS